MASAVHNVTIDCSDPYALGCFWSAVLGVPLHPDDEPGDPEAVIELPAFTLLLQHVPEPRARKNRLHLDLQPQTGPATRRSSGCGPSVPRCSPTTAATTGPAGSRWPTPRATSCASSARRPSAPPVERAAG